MSSRFPFTQSGVALRLIAAVALGFLSLILTPPVASADIATDGTVGPATSLSGPDYRIPQSLGTTAGDNLFHSFERFSLIQNENATFTGSDAIANVISRVTGGDVSTIDGLLRSEVGQADFFFINPAGVVFGPNSQVDVPAAFHVSTADEIQFGDGKVFSAADPDKSMLTMAQPASFGYLTPQPASIFVDGSRLSFAPKSDVSLIGGDVTINGSWLREAEVVSEGGDIRLVAVGDWTGEVPVGYFPNSEMNGNIHIESASVDASGPGGGRIAIKAGNGSIVDASVSANNTGNQDDTEGGVHMGIDDSFSLSNGVISSSTFAQGDAGGVTIQADDLRIDGGEEGFALIGSQAETDSSGNAGSVEITVVGLLKVLNGGVISSSTFAQGDAGGVTIQAGDLRFDGGEEGIALILSSAYPGSTGNASSVKITVEGLLEVLNGGRISSSTFAQGDAGGVTIQAGDLRIDGGGDVASIKSQANSGSSGNAGSVEITVDGLVEVLNGGEISSSTFAQGDGGGVTMQAGDLRIDGGEDISGIASLAGPDSTSNAGSVEVTVDGVLEVLNGGAITSDTFAEGDAGDVSIKAGELKIEGGESNFTGISIDANADTTSNAGSVEVFVEGLLEVLNGGEISSTTFAQGDAGSVIIQAGDFRIDGGEEVSVIVSQAGPGSTGNAGSVDITVEGLLEVMNGGGISSSTFRQGDAGSVTIQAGNLRIDGGKESAAVVVSQANPGSRGNAGSVEVTIDGLLEVLNGGQIASSTFAQGNAGSVIIQAGDLRIDGGENGAAFIGSQANPSSIGNAGSVEITVAGLLKVMNGGEVSSSTLAQGNAGGVTIQTSDLKVDGGEKGFASIGSQANPGSIGNAGLVEVSAEGFLEVSNGGQISSSTLAQGDAGGVTIQAGTLKVDGGEEGLASIGSQAVPGSTGNAGSADVNVEGLLELSNGAQISSSTFGQGDAGGVTIQAGALKVDGGEEGLASIVSKAGRGSSGNAGSVEVTAEGFLEVSNGGEISSSTFAQGNAGGVTIQAGALKVDGDEEGLASIGSQAVPGSTGNAGPVEITVDGLVEVLNVGLISSSTFAQGDAGGVTMQAGDIRVDGGKDGFAIIASMAAHGSSGNAGSVEITVEGVLEVLNGGLISTGTGSEGDAGYVTIKAEELRLDGDEAGLASITSEALAGSTGNAGTVNVAVDDFLELLNGGQISSSGSGEGNAGSVIVVSARVRVDGEMGDADTPAGILSQSFEGSNGYVGSVFISSDEITVQNNGQISITAFNALEDDRLSDVPDNTLRIDSATLTLDQSAQITAESSANVPAAAIDIRVDELVVENGSRISTISNNADGGPIRVNGETIIFRDALMTTSVEGLAGDGGDIAIAGKSGGPANVFLFDGGFIQANTAAQDARGGDIFIDVRAVIAHSGLLQVGGAERQIFQPGSGLNVIQAAAPGGEQGTIAITAPNLDISGTLVNVSTGFSEPIRTANDPCRAAAGETPSTLVLCGQGGLPAGPGNPSVAPMGEDRLDRLMKAERTE